MPFEKGSSGNPQGRKTGTPNKTTKEMRKIIQTSVENYFTKSTINKDIKQLSPKNRIEVMLKMMEFTVPKLKTEEVEKTEKSTFEHFLSIRAQMEERRKEEEKIISKQIHSAPDSAPK
jgi:hypothetical protein